MEVQKANKFPVIKHFDVGGGTYSVASDGHVYGQNRKELCKYVDRDGYEYVVIRVNNKRKKLFVHRLVAMMFIPNQNRFPQVNHIDGEKKNNTVENLEWVTNSQNQIHSRYSLHNKTGFADTPVLCVETGEKYISTRDAWRKTGINYCHISECACGKRKTAGGFRWKKVTPHCGI